MKYLTIFGALPLSAAPVQAFGLPETTEACAACEAMPETSRACETLAHCWRATAAVNMLFLMREFGAITHQEFDKWRDQHFRYMGYYYKIGVKKTVDDRPDCPIKP